MLKTRGNRITYFGHGTFSLSTPSSQAAFAFLTGTVEELRKETKKIKGLTIHALKPGESI
ncbi:MAG: hypothetical protein ACHQLQ_00290 [Candidatus Acidiferrales bacterium]